MLEFVVGMDTLFQEFQRLPPSAARGLVKLRVASANCFRAKPPRNLQLWVASLA